MTQRDLKSKMAKAMAGDVVVVTDKEKRVCVYVLEGTDPEGMQVTFTIPWKVAKNLVKVEIER